MFRADTSLGYYARLLCSTTLLLSLAATIRAVEAPPAAPNAVTPGPVAQPAVVIPRLQPRPFAWRPLSLQVPQSIRVYEGEAVNADGQPLHAWYADIDYSDRGLHVKSVLSRSASGRETTSALAKQVGALVALNGAFFSMDPAPLPAPTYNTVISEGKVLAKNPATVKRGGRDVYGPRGVFGVRDNRTFDISWVAHIDDKTYAYPVPLPNAPQAPAAPPSAIFPAAAREWNDIREAMGGGPVLIKNGEIRITAEEELFGASFSTTRHPRSAVGFNGKNRLILFAVDGRQPSHSVGMSLPELAQTMKDLGCTEALNLDGGGSTAFVVNGQVLNKPAGSRERQVTAVLTVVPDAELKALQLGEKPLLNKVAR